ncbi:hypothetical protein ABEO92_10575 [Geobacillus stearothermophilus]|uniref:glycoside hydrolase family 113 n=1 Tax=Geobacillus stearothermophilus TaxID=1422 RepID=UPI003D1B53B3
MAVNRTPNLGLHDWLGTEYVKREEIVENFRKIDNEFGASGRVGDLSNKIGILSKDVSIKNRETNLSNSLLGFKGLCVRTWETGFLYTDRFRIYTINKAKTIKADTIELIVNTYQPSETDNNPASRVPVPLSEVEDYIKFLKEQGFKVFFKPHVEIDVTPYQWRANINPNDANTWFANYTNLMVDYAEICEKYNVEIFSVGSEYKTLTETYPDKWRDVISAVRNVYSGILTYGANCTSGNNDEVMKISFWDVLDYIGVDYYIVPTNDLTATKETIKNSFYYDKNKDNSVLALDRVSQKYGKPLLIAEYGYSVGTSPTQQQLDFQKNYVDALLDIFLNKENTKGAFAWVVDPVTGGSTESYLKDGTTIETVIKGHYEKRSKSAVTPLKMYGTPKNNNPTDKWAKIASITLPETYTTASCVLYIENLLANTSSQKRGDVYFRVGSDNGMTSFVEVRLNAESTLSTSDVGYVINGNEVSLYLKVPQYHQYVYRLKETNAVNIVKLYDYPTLEGGITVTTASKTVYTTSSDFDLGSSNIKFPNGVKIITGETTSSMSNGLINLNITLPAPIGWVKYCHANIKDVSGGNVYDVIAHAKPINSTTIQILGKHTSGTGNYGFTVQWVAIGN